MPSNSFTFSAHGPKALGVSEETTIAKPTIVRPAMARYGRGLANSYGLAGKLQLVLDRSSGGRPSAWSIRLAIDEKPTYIWAEQCFL